MGVTKKISRKFLELKNYIMKVAKITDGTSVNNIKLGNMGTWAMLFGNCDWYIPELDVTVRGTCGQNCKGCFNPEDPWRSPCYVVKAYRYTKKNEDGSKGNILTNSCAAKLGHAYRTIAMTMFRKDLLESLDKQLDGKRKPFEVVRINESGELTCYEDLALWCELARRHPETVFYLYSKNYKVVRKALISNIVPNNLFINISIWHKSGIKAYKEMKGNSQIRAFVLIDKKWTKEKYKANGIEITSMCGAYNEKGKMNHAVTCDKCKKCFGVTNKCVGCYEH